MKTKTSAILALLVVIVVIGASPLPAQQNTGFEITGIEVSTPTTPDYNSDYRKRSSRQKWIEVEVGFSAKPEFTEELTFRYYVFFDSVKPNTIFTGEVTHVSIPETREAYSVMYIAPQTLERVLEGRSVTNSSVTHIGVQILKQGQLVAESSTTGAPKGQWWTTAQNLDGYLLNKDETPFAPLVWDRYEAIKPSR